MIVGLNIQVFEDIDGRRVEIDRREVCDAYIEILVDRRAVVVLTSGEHASVTHLGVGAREFVEEWLGRKLETERPNRP